MRQAFGKLTLAHVCWKYMRFPANVRERRILAPKISLPEETYNATSLISLYHDMDLKHSVALRLFCITKSPDARSMKLCWNIKYWLFYLLWTDKTGCRVACFTSIPILWKQSTYTWDNNFPRIDYKVLKNKQISANKSYLFVKTINKNQAVCSILCL